MGKQPSRVLAYLQQHRTMTALDCWNYCGVYRASDAIYKLRKAGYSILTEDVEVKNQFGEGCTVARYTLVASTPQVEPAPAVYARA